MQGKCSKCCSNHHGPLEPPPVKPAEHRTRDSIKIPNHVHRRGSPWAGGNKCSLRGAGLKSEGSGGAESFFSWGVEKGPELRRGTSREFSMIGFSSRDSSDNWGIVGRGKGGGFFLGFHSLL